MTDERTPAQIDTPGEQACGPTLAPVRRRGESHLLALMLAAAVVFVATAIAKPWGDSAPLPTASAATPSLPAEIARSSAESVSPPTASATPSLPAETVQRVFIVVQPGDVSVTYTSITYTVVCTEDPGASPPVIESAEPVAESAEPVAESAEPVVGFLYVPGGATCTGADLQGIDWVPASPSAP